MSGNGNDTITFKRWHVGLGSLLAVGLYVTSFIFRVGGTDTATRMRLDAIEKHLDYDDSVFVRKDGGFALIEQRLAYVEAQENRIETEQEQQTQQLEKLLARERH